MLSRGLLYAWVVLQLQCGDIAYASFHVPAVLGLALHLRDVSEKFWLNASGTLYRCHTLLERNVIDLRGLLRKKARSAERRLVCGQYRFLLLQS